MQADPVTDHAVHVDFLAVKSDEKVRAEVPVVLIGESPVEKLNLGSVQQVLMQVEVEAFPMDLPPSIEFDVSVLDHVGMTVHVSDLKVGKNVEIIEDMEATVVTTAEFEEEKEDKNSGAAAVADATPAA